MSKWPTMNTEWNLYPKLWTFSQADKATSMVSQNKLFSCEGTLSGQEWNNILKLKWVFVNHKWNSFIYTFLSPITNNVKFWILSDTLFYTGLKLQQWNFWTAFLYCSAKYILKHHKRFVIVKIISDTENNKTLESHYNFNKWFQTHSRGK